MESSEAGEPDKDNTEKVALVEEAQGTCDTKQNFKKLKKSHNEPRSYRPRNLHEDDEGEANSSQSEGVERRTPANEDQSNDNEGVDVAEPVTADSLEPIHDSSDEEQQQARRSRVRARRIVRFGILSRV